ncbi:MAG: FAD:protein FMN transferase [Deltaproteobacteria bacterium]|nr:FAD:protein FMN transferase [Deltaproteobacteria bacterium]
MGTTYNISVYTKKRAVFLSLQKDIDALLTDINQQVSTYIPTSQISQVNTSSKNIPMVIGKHFAPPLRTALDIAKSTDGIYDPTIGPLVNLWGFGPHKTQKKPSEADIAQALASIGYQYVDLRMENGIATISKLKDDIQIDLSSVAKGYAVDQIAEYLLQRGFINHLVEIGGEMRALGKKGPHPWIVAIEKPIEGVRSPYKGFPLLNHSLATSGNYRNYFTQDHVNYAHTLHPKTGQPATSSLLSASVMHKSCMQADALATALMAMGDQKAIAYVEKHKLDVFLIFRDEQHGLRHKKFGMFAMEVNTP